MASAKLTHHRRSELWGSRTKINNDTLASPFAIGILSRYEQDGPKRNISLPDGVAIYVLGSISRIDSYVVVIPGSTACI
jgi:ATP-dependent helicase/DNAse subunit B